jgi:hypothetical protein
VRGEGLGPVVLVPGDRASAGHEEVDVAVAVAVGDDDGLRVDDVRDEPLGEGLRPVVLVPGQRVAGVGREREVDVAVAVDVRDAGGGAVVRERGDDALREGPVDPE